MGIDPFREMANAMRSRTGFDGTILKFSKGCWTAGKDATDMGDKELIAHVDQLMYGWTKWEDKKPVDYHVGFVRDRYKPPRRRELGDNDPGKCERRDQDPWQLTFFLPLTDPNDGELFVYSTTSRGGKDALANLQDAFADNREHHPKDADKLPLTGLSSDHYPHPDYGRVETPELDIVRWVDAPVNMKAIKPPASASPFLAIEHNSESQPESDSEPAFGTPQSAERTVPTKKSGGSFADLDDEIPF
jgi:hypothetical protein